MGRPLRAGAPARARGRADAAGARRLPRDARAGDDDARGRADLRARRPAARPGERLEQPGLVRALELLAEEGAASVYAGTIAESLLALDRRARRRRHARRPRRRTSRAGPSRSRSPTPARASSRAAGLAGVADDARAPAPRSRLASRRARSRSSTRSTPSAGRRRTRPTSSPSTPTGNACVLTTSLGLGSGDWLPGLDLHLNSMLGEVDLLVGALEPGRADAEHDGAERRARRRRPRPRDRRGGRHAAPHRARQRSRRRSSTRASSRRRPSTGRASTAPATSSTPSPGSTRTRSPSSSARGLAVRRWPDRHHYFGGVSLVSRAGAAADPRRSGARRRACVRPGPLGPLGRLDVARDLVDQRLLAVEDLLVAQALPQLDHEPPAVQVAGEAEQERLDPQLVAAVVRVRPDRDRGAVTRRRSPA